MEDLKGEVWKDIAGYEGLYAVSNFGRVKSLAREMPHNAFGTWHVKERILKPAWTGYKKGHSDGYLYVNLHKGHNQQKPSQIHRLVAEAFIPKVEGKNVVNHKDCDRSNNTLENLEWTTPLENTRHALKNGRIDHGYHSKPVRNVETGEVFKSTRDAERQYSVAYGAISRAVKKGAVSCGCHWVYAE